MRVFPQVAREYRQSAKHPQVLLTSGQQVAIGQKPANDDVQTTHRHGEQPVLLPEPGRPADEAAQGQLGPKANLGHFVHIDRPAQPVTEQVPLVRAQQVAAAGKEPPGDPAVEDGEIQSEHLGLRRADSAGGDPAEDRAARGTPSVGGEHRVKRGRSD